MESIIKGKHATNSLLTLKSEVNLYKESIVRIYEKNHHKSPKK